MDPPSEQGDENRQSSGSSCAPRDGSRSQQQQQQQRRNPQNGGSSLDPVPPSHGKVAKGGRVNNSGHPDPLLQQKGVPRFKDQAQPAGFEAHGGGGADLGATDGSQHPDPLLLPQYKDQARPAGFETGGGGGSATTTIPWAPSVRALSEEVDDTNNNNNNNIDHLPTLTAVIVQTPPMSRVNNSNNNNNDLNSMEMASTLPPGVGRTQQIVLRKHMIWAGACVVTVLGIAVAVSVALAVVMSGSSSPPTVLPPETTATPAKSITLPPDEVATAPPTLQRTVAPTKRPVTLEPSSAAPIAMPPSTAVPTRFPTALPTASTDQPVSTNVNPYSALKLTASDGAAGDEFGTSVGISEDTMVIGASGDDTENGSNSGSVYVYTRSGFLWTEQAKLTASDGSADDEFGISVAITGNTIVIGAHKANNENGDGSGSAYVYTRGSENVWKEQAKLTASDGAPEDRFGVGVAIDGNTIVIGAFGFHITTNNSGGSAYVYNFTGSVWTEQAKLTASVGAPDDAFGYSVAIDGKTIVIGAYVYIFTGTFWTEQMILTASDGAPNDGFGTSVAIDGDTIVIGADEDENENGDFSGSAYIYILSGATWTEQAKLMASEGAAFDYLGSSVDIDGDTVLVGAALDDDGYGSGSAFGSAYLFTRSASTWTEQAKLIANDGDANDLLGNSVAILRDAIFVGALYDDDNGENSGSVYVFDLI